jgi:hypothetical protein
VTERDLSGTVSSRLGIALPYDGIPRGFRNRVRGRRMTTFVALVLQRESRSRVTDLRRLARRGGLGLRRLRRQRRINLRARVAQSGYKFGYSAQGCAGRAGVMMRRKSLIALVPEEGIEPTLP